MTDANLIFPSWETEVKVYSKDKDGKMILTNETIKVPYQTTRHVVKMQIKLSEIYKEYGMDMKDEAPEGFSSEEKLAWEEERGNRIPWQVISEATIDVLMPGLMDRMHPDSLTRLSVEVSEKSAEINENFQLSQQQTEMIPDKTSSE